MNVQTAPAARPSTPAVVPFTARSVRRERDFGVGYGKSSGYATDRRYVNTAAQPRYFRFA